MSAQEAVEAVYSHDLAVPLDTVWRLLDNFGDLHWIPGNLDVTTQGTGVGMSRTIVLPGVGAVREELAFKEPGAHRYGYVVSGDLPYPVADYRAEVSLSMEGPSTCRVTWHGTFRPRGASPEEARETMRAVYRQIAGWIELHLGA